jgi:hypothetical protein
MNNPEIFGHSGPLSYIERTMIIPINSIYAVDSINENLLFGTPVETPINLSLFDGPCTQLTLNSLHY